MKDIKNILIRLAHSRVELRHGLGEDLDPLHDAFLEKVGREVLNLGGKSCRDGALP